MKIAVTGAGSFIGAAFHRFCERRGIEWVGVDVKPGPGRIEADIARPGWWEALPEGIDSLVHLAAVSRDADCRRDPARAIEVNLAGTARVIEAAKVRGIGQIVFASSEWVYGDVDASLKNEDTPIEATSLTGEYALTKLCGERLLWMANARSGVGATVLRFGIVYGPRPDNWSAVEALHDAVGRQERVQVGARLTGRRFIHVDDIAAGLGASLGRGGFEVFNLTGDRVVTLGEIVEASACVHGRKTPEVEERDPGRVTVRNIDNARAKAALGWRPGVSLHEGLAGLVHLPAGVAR